MQKILRQLVLVFSALLAVACSPSANPSREAEVSIAHLKSLCKGEHHLITEGYYVRGVVVATDWLGELNKRAVIMDESGGLEIAIELSNVAELLPIYSEVVVRCNGLMLARIGGKIELGMAPTGDFPLDNIDDERVSHYISIVGISDDVAPQTKQFSEIGVGDISSFVRFDNVRICDEEQGLTWCESEEGGLVTTYRTLINRGGESFAVRILPTCHYADEEMPTKEMSVVGVIDYSDNRPFLQIVNNLII